MVSTHLNMDMFCFDMFQVCLEFSRVVGKSLRQEFYEALDHHSPRLMDNNNHNIIIIINNNNNNGGK